MEGRVTTSLGSIRKRLAELPNLKMVSYGTVLGYQAFDEGQKSPSMVIRISNQAMNVRLFVAESTPLSHAESLIKLLSLLAVLHEDYEMGLGQLYTPIMESLRGFVLPKGVATADRHAEMLELQAKALSSANANIAAKLVDCMAGLDRVAAERDSYRRACTAMFVHIGGISRNDEMMAKNLEAIGIDGKMLDELRALLGGSVGKVMA